MFEFLSTLGVVGILGGILLFIAVIMIVLGVSALLAEQEFTQRRLATPAQDLVIGSPKLRVTLEDGVLKQFENLVTPKNLAELHTIRRRLIQAGYRKPSAVRIYYVLKATLGLTMAVLGAIGLPLFPIAMPLPVLGLGIIVFLFIGYFLPDYWVERQIQTRKQEAELGFPDLLDMLLICMEAGNGLDQACRRVAREINKVNKILADELGVVNDELYAGKSRPAVFRDFADRINVQDISAFAAVLRQSDEFGVSIADTLRIYSDELRHKRVMRAEEKANMMPVKLALGSIAFTIPPTMLIMAGPSVIMIVRTLGGSL
jgi:tight adherence protein C